VTPGHARRALVAYIAVALGMFVSASFDAFPVIDDAWGILGHVDEPLGPTLLHAFTLPSYAPSVLASGAGAAPGSASYAWGPITTLVQALVASAFGRDAIAPFRVANVCVLALGVCAAGAATGVLARSRTAGVLCAALLVAHPVVAECVPWASDLFDVLAATVLVVGMLGATRARSTGQFVAASALGLGVACLCKPTAGAMGVVFPVLALVSGRGVRAAVASAAAVAVVGGGFAAAYGAVTGSHLASSALQDIAAKPAARAGFALSYGVSLLDAVRPLSPPAVMRYPSAAIDGVRAAGGALAVGFGAAAAGFSARRGSEAARWAVAGLVAWCVGLVPGSLVAVSLGTHGTRYSLLPLFGAAPFLLAAGRLALDGCSDALRKILVGLGGMLLVGQLGWLHSRAPAYRSDADFFAAEASSSELDLDPDAKAKLDLFAAQSVFFASLEANGPVTGVNPCEAGLGYVRAVDGLGPSHEAYQAGRYQRAVALLVSAGPRASVEACGVGAHGALSAALAQRLGR